MKFLLKVFVLISLIGLSKLTKNDTLAIQQAVLPETKAVPVYVQETDKATLLNDEPVSATQVRIQKTSLRMN